MNTLENRRYGTIEDFNKSNFDLEKKYVFVLNHQNPNPSMAGKLFPNSYSLKLEDSIFCSNKKINRVIRVVDGEVSIYKDEQTEDGQRREPKRITFSPQGDFVVEGIEKLTLEWFIKTNKNGSNIDRNKNTTPIFYLLNLEKGLEEQMEKDKSDAEAINWCYTAEFKHLLRYARVLGINIDSDPSEIRWNLRNLAKKDPKKFMDGLKNKYTTRKFFILEALDRGLVVEDSRANSLLWSNGGLICVSPMGQSVVDYFVDLSISTTNMDMTYRTIHELIEPTAKAEPTPTIAPAEVVARAEEILAPTYDHLKPLVEEAVKKAVVVKKGVWYYYKERRYKGHEFVRALGNDNILSAMLEKDVKEKVLV